MCSLCYWISKFLLLLTPQFHECIGGVVNILYFHVFLLQDLPAKTDMPEGLFVRTTCVASV